MKIDLGEDFIYKLHTEYKDMTLGEALAKQAFIGLISEIDRLKDEENSMHLRDSARIVADHMSSSKN
jgi:hypothetical protein